jgi:hypothetical protein
MLFFLSLHIFNRITTSANVPPSMIATKFHTHTKRQAKSFSKSLRMHPDNFLLCIIFCGWNNPFGLSPLIIHDNIYSDEKKTTLSLNRGASYHTLRPNERWTEQGLYNAP